MRDFSQPSLNTKQCGGGGPRLAHHTVPSSLRHEAGALEYPPTSGPSLSLSLSISLLIISLSAKSFYC